MTTVQLSLVLLLLVTTVVIYFPSLSGSFNNWDDYVYVTGNPHLQLTKANIISSFFHGENHGMYLPLTSLTFSLNYYFAGFNPYSYHVVNLLLHLFTIILVFLFIYRLSRSFEVGFITACLFAVHAMQVESVAYIAGRRDILYSVFFILACITYIRYMDGTKRKFYFYTLLLFVLSLFSKGQAVSLPVTLIILDFLRGEKIFSKKLIIEKIPFFILSLIFGIIAFKVKNTTSDFRVTADIIGKIPFYERAILACFGYLVYVLKLIVPFSLSVVYPYPVKSGQALSAAYYLYPLLLAGLLISAYLISKKGNKILAFGLLFFSINIFFVLQLVPNSYGIINEHYVYLPSIGLFFIIASAYKWVCEHRKKLKSTMIFILTAYLIFLSVFSFSRCSVWKDSVTLFTDVINKYPGDPLAYVERGNAKNDMKDYAGAIRDYDRAVRLQPGYQLAYLNRGLSLYYLKKYDEALADMNEAIKIIPHSSIAHNNRGMIENGLKNYQDAITDLNEALQIDKDYAFAYFNRGYAYLGLNDFENALMDFNKGIALNDNNPQSFLNRGFAKLYQKDYEGALKDFDHSIKLKPDYLDAYVNRGTLKSNFLNDYQGAVNDFSEALQISQSSPMVYFNRGVAKYKLNDFHGACVDWQKAYELGDTAASKTIQQYCK